MLQSCTPHIENLAAATASAADIATAAASPAEWSAPRPAPNEDVLRAAIARLVGDSEPSTLSAKSIRRRLEAEFACSLAEHGYRELILAAIKLAIEERSRSPDAAGRLGAAQPSVSSLAPATFSPALSNKQSAPASEAHHELVPPAAEPALVAPKTDTPTVLGALMLAQFASNSLFVAGAQSALPPQPLPLPLPVPLPPLESQLLVPARLDEQHGVAAGGALTPAEQLQLQLLQVRRGRQAAQRARVQPVVAVVRATLVNEEQHAAAGVLARGRKRAAPQPPSPSSDEGPDTPSLHGIGANGAATAARPATSSRAICARSTARSAHSRATCARFAARERAI